MEHQHDDQPEQPPEQPPGQPDDSRRLRVLLIEDDSHWQNVVRRILTSINSRVLVRTATLAEAGIELIGNGSGFDLIIADFYLGGPLTGADVQKFCANAKNPTAFVLFSSRDRAELEKLLEPGSKIPIISKSSRIPEITQQFAAAISSIES